MKKSTKRLFSIITIVLTLVVGTSIFASCGNSSKKTIGIIQFGSHQSLNNCYDGIVKGLKEGGIDLENEYKIDLQLSQFDPSVSASQARTLAGKNVEMIGAIATPSAMAAATSADGKIPVVYCAVSDPVSAGLTSMPNVAGSSDLLDFENQLILIKSFLPNVKRIGVMYTTTEENSISQIATLKALANAQNIEIVTQSVTNANEIPAAVTTLLNKDIDCMTNLTDNTIVEGGLQIILEKAKDKGIPVFGSEIEQVKAGCLASASLDYVELGRKTGLMMAQILKGEKTITTGEFISIKDSFKCYSSTVAQSYGLAIPQLEMVDVVE